MATNTNKLMLSGIYQMGKTIRDNFSFIKLNDTPADYIPGKYVRVKNSADGLEYVDIEASSSDFDNYQDIFLSKHMNQAFLSGLYEGEAIHNYLYDINVDSNNTNGGTVLITESSYNFASVIYDQNINIQASVNDGYYFSHWDGSNVTFVDSLSESTQAYINKDTKITGYFTLDNPQTCSTSPVTITVESEYIGPGNSVYKYTTSDSNGNGDLFGCINVNRGETLTIFVTGDQPNLESHPLKITNFNDLGQEMAPLDGVVKTDLTEGPYEDYTYSLTWTVPCDTEIDKYQYQCENHAHMRGTINVFGTCPNPTPTPTSSSTPTPTPTPTLTPSSIPQNTEGNDSFPYTLPLQLS